MKYKNTRRLLVLFAGLLATSSSVAQSPVFKVSKGENYLYIGGTIHLLAQSDYPLPLAFDKAFKDSGRVFFETDTAQLSLPENQIKAAQLMTYSDGRTLKSELDAETYKRLEQFLTERQIPIALFHQLTPGAVSITLTLMEIQRLGLGDPSSGVDQFFENRARDTDIPRSYLETVEEQISFLNEFNRVDPNVVVNSTIEDLSGLNESWKAAVSAWRAGDLETMSDSLNLKELSLQFPSLYKVLLTDRNDRWVPEIELLLETDEIEFILFGAAHLVEGNGVIKQLQKKGFTIEQMD